MPTLVFAKFAINDHAGYSRNQEGIFERISGRVCN